jgi:acetyl esterase/lipase
MVSKEAQKVIRDLKQLKVSAKAINVKELRAASDARANMVSIQKDVDCRAVDAGGVPGEWISTPGVVSQHVILYLHGGGYVAGSVKESRGLASMISRVSSARVLSIDYRLAPEAVFPAAVEDAVTAYQWLLSAEGITPDNVVVAGDSAGGGLTAATLLKLRDDGIALPAAAVCLSPWTDLANTGGSFKSKVDVDPSVRPEELEFDARQYLGREDPRNPLASPLYADLHGLPPLLIQVGTSEILLDDSVRLADRLKGAGVDVELDIWKDMIHVFPALGPSVPESRQAIDQIGKFIREFLK